METLQSPILFDELIVEILSRLPVKSLLRFKCVSKSWKSLITDPSFIKLHLQNSPKGTNNLVLTLWNGNDRCFVPCSIHSLLENPSSTVTVSEEDIYQLKGEYRVVGSCNGLVCLRGNDISYYSVLFWNPATRLTSRSPNLPVRLGIDAVPVDFGFVYDNSSDTYKVVAIFGGSCETILKVYNMGEDDCWRKILISIPVFRFACFSGQSLSGTHNSLALYKYKSHADTTTTTIERVVIFSVDMVKETYKQLLLPDGFKHEEYSCGTRLGVFRDSVCLIHDYKRTHFIIWQMKEFGDEKSWTQLVNVSYQHLQIQKKRFLPLSLCISENGDVVVLTNNKDLEAILYNKHCLDVKDYVESLVLPR